MITFSWGLVLCLGCKHTQTAVSDETAYGVRLTDVTCERCRKAGCAWLERAGKGVTRALADERAADHRIEVEKNKQQPLTLPDLHRWKLRET